MRMLSSGARSSLASQIEQYHQHLGKVANYLASRGITQETAERFQLGWNPENGRLVIPYLTPAGPFSLKQRCIQPHDCKTEGHGKYVYDAGAVPHLYNASTLLDCDSVVVVEGELDAVVAEQVGVPAVAYPGTANWQKHMPYCFDSQAEIVVIADGDDPGRKAADRVAASLRDAVSGEVRVVEMPAGHDTGSFVQEFGEFEFLERIGWI